MNLLKRLGWLITAPLALAIIGFAIANRHSALISLDPFSMDAPALSFEMPMWLALFMALLTGIILGAVSTWTAQAGHQLKRRARQKTDKKAEKSSDPLENMPTIAPAQAMAPMLQPPHTDRRAS